MELNLLHNLSLKMGHIIASVQIKMPVNNKTYSLKGTVLTTLGLFLGLVLTINASAQLTGVKTVGTGGDYATLTAAITALNTVGVGTGGVTFSVKGGLNETVPNGNITPNPDITAGLLITKGGTAANPIVIKWDSIGVKPIVRAGTGIGDYDFVLGIAGQDYITIDGLSIRENTANNTNTKRAEIGIGLFKEKYNPSTGNNGCQHVTIKNCDIRLTQYPNVHQNIGYTCFNSFSTGIKLTSFTATHLGSTSIGYFGSSNPNQGIITAQDVHSFNTVIGNLIDSCVIGISLGDGFYKSGNNLVAAGMGNIIGQLNGGNTITHFGPLSTVTYYYGSYYSTIAAIDVGGQHDFSIEYNTINGCVSDNAPYLTSMAGIYAGESTGGAYSLPRSATGLFKINHNTVTNIDSRNLANNTKLISGINFNSSGENNQLASGSVEINDNNISNLYSVRGDCIAINSELFTANITVPSTYLYSGFQTNGDVSISRNTISNILRESPVVDGLVSAIFWKQGSKNLYINNNKISNLTLGTTTVSPTNFSAAGMQVIYVHSYFSNADRLLVEIKGNKLESCNVLASPSAYNGMTFSGIYLLSGGITNNIKQDTVINCNIANGGNLNSQSYMDMIRVDGQPTGTGVSTINIDSCYIANDIRTGQHSTDNYGLLCLLRGIVCDNASSNQVRNITNNTITGLSHMLASGATFQQGSHVITRGIYTTGRYTPGNVTNISDNNITNFSGLSGGFTQVASNNASVQYRFAMTGIAAEIFNKLNIYRNNISGFNTGISQGYQADGDYLSGPCGITIYNNTPAYETTLDIHNNFVSDLKAPAMRSKLAVNGIAISGLVAKANVNHNTIVLGSANGDSTGRLSSTTTGAFGVTGLLIASYYYNTQAYTIDYRNNIISINATAKNTGANMCVRNFDYTALKSAPLGTAKTTTGNTYFINPGLRNYIYGQGTTYNITGGIRNAYALTGATINTTYNLVNDDADASTSFNTKCGLYKSFMSGKDRQSYAEADNTNVTPQPIPFLNTGTAPQNLRG